MARSSGGGSRSGGSRSSGGSSRSSGGSRSGSRSSHRVSNTPFLGSRTFRYYRNGRPIYIYSDKDLTQMKDPKPRWFAIIFYIPFIFVILGMIGEMIQMPQKPMDTYIESNVQVIDTLDVFTLKEEQSLEKKLKEFGDTTGITTQIVTIDYDEWTDNGTLENYALNRYYAQFDDENGWLLVYSELDNGYGDWNWEGIQGDDTIDTMDVFISDFNKKLNSELTVNQVPDPAEAFDKAFDKAIDVFENQTLRVDLEMLPMIIFMSLFIGVHSFIMIFAGTRKKYSYKELEEVGKSEQLKSEPPKKPEVVLECEYCGYQTTNTKNNQCPNCGAIIKEGIE